MNTNRNIIVSSISDCREKNGVVTFMMILKSNASAFLAQGLTLKFVNFVDFPSAVGAAPSPPNRPAAMHSEQVFPLRSDLRDIVVRMKRSIKQVIVARPLGALLLLMSTLGGRAFVVAWKARRHEQEGTIHFYQDFLCASFGRVLHSRNTCKVLLLHSGNDPLNHLFTHFHGMRGTRYELLVRKLFSSTLKAQDALVTLNEHFSDILRAELPGIDIRCIYNTSPFEISSTTRSARHATTTSRIEIVAVGSLQYIKGFDLLVEALARMEIIDRSRLHVTVVGGGKEHVPLQAAIEAASLDEIVTLQGECSDVSPFLLRADAYILTSRDEGFPIALIEAAFFGLPIVSTRVGSIPEVFDETSCLFIGNEVDSIRDALSRIARGEVDLTSLAQRAREVFEAKLSKDIFLKAYFKLFKTLGERSAN